jgi:hypothetical protein
MLSIIRTNGVNNPNQSTLDLREGSNVTLTPGLQGVVTIAASGGGGGFPPSGAANLVLATPNGSSGVVSLRSLVVADLPNPIDIGTF